MIFFNTDLVLWNLTKLIYFNGFWVNILYHLVCSMSKDRLSFWFWVWMSFFFFPCCIVLLELPVWCWIEEARADVFILFLILGRKQSVFLIKCDNHCGFFINALLTDWGSFLLILVVTYFMMKKCWILSNFFSVSIEMIVWFLFFGLLIRSVTVIDFYMLN